MNYLAIDASTEACSVALQYIRKDTKKSTGADVETSTEQTIFTRYEICPQSHSLRLLPMIDEVLKEANCKLSELDGLIYGRGPGSFTGVRIGIGVAQGLAFAADLPVVGVSTLQAMAQLAYTQYQQTQVIAAIDARMSEIYTAYYTLEEATKLMQLVLPEQVLAPDVAVAYYKEQLASDINSSIINAYGVGTGWDAYQTALSVLKNNGNSPDILFPDAEVMLTLGQAAFANGEGVSAEQAQPVYVRDTVSWKKLPGRE